MKLRMTFLNDCGKEITAPAQIFIPDGDLDRVIKDSTAAIYAKGMEECCELAQSLAKLMFTLGSNYSADSKRFQNTASEFVDVLIMMMLILRQNPEIYNYINTESYEKCGRFICRSLEHQVIFRTKASRDFAMISSDKSFKKVMKKIRNGDLSEDDRHKYAEIIKEYGMLIGKEQEGGYGVYGDSNAAPEFASALFDLMCQKNLETARNYVEAVTETLAENSQDDAEDEDEGNISKLDTPINYGTAYREILKRWNEKFGHQGITKEESKNLSYEISDMMQNPEKYEFSDNESMIRCLERAKHAILDASREKNSGESDEEDDED